MTLTHTHTEVRRDKKAWGLKRGVGSSGTNELGVKRDT